MKSFFSSLRVRLILLVLLATLPALLLTIYNGQEQRQHAETDALENALQLAEFAASKNELLIEDTRIILISLSHAMDFAGTDLSGCGHLLTHLKDVHFPFYSAFYVADLEGNILCSMPYGDLPADLLGCQHYQSLIASDNFVVSEYHLCRNTGKGVISMGYPIWDSGEEKIGVINVGIDLMWFNEFAMQAELPPDSTLTVFDRDGIILAQYPDPELWVGETLPEGSVQELVFQQKSGTTRSFDVDNVERLYAFLPLSGSEESVFIMLGIPADYAFADVERTMIRNIILIGIVLLLTLVAAWFLSDAFVTRQINQLVDTTQRLASGDLSARSQSGYEHGEFGVLNMAIDEMAESLATRERERKLAEDSVREYAANLERSNRDLLDFANIASHDLQEPLRKISTFSDMLVTRYSGSLDKQANEYLDRIQSSVNRMQTLIIDLLTYSRISTKSQQLDQVDLRPILDQVLLDLELKVEESNAAIQIGDLPLIHADPIQMHQLYFNLIGNSLKFYKPGTPVMIKITGGLVSIPEGGREGFDWHEICVVDNGIGFDEKYLDRIFQPFERLHNSNEYEGNGMGLAICRKILERHRGEITANSQPGQGATFIVRFPVFNGEGLDL
ncbi:ATP-binding protein [Chloroflexota bacterium]